MENSVKALKSTNDNLSPARFACGASLIMECAIVTLGQLKETGRLDAVYNIAYKKHERELNELLTRVSRSDLEQTAKACDRDFQAARVRAGNETRWDFEKWTDIELGLYIILIAKKQALKSGIEAQQAKIDAANKVSQVLATIEEVLQ